MGRIKCDIKKKRVFHDPWRRRGGGGFFQHHAKTKKTTMPMMAATPGCAFVAGAAPGNVIRLEVGLGGKTVPVPDGDRVVGASETVVEELELGTGWVYVVVGGFGMYVVVGSGEMEG